MGFGLEWHCDHCATVRAGDEFRKHGDDFTQVCTLYIEGGMAYVAGLLSSRPTYFPWSEFRRLLRSMGVKVIRYARRTESGMAHRAVSL